MANKGKASQPRGMSLEEAHEMRRGKAIINHQEQVRKLTTSLSRFKDMNVDAVAIGSLM